MDIARCLEDGLTYSSIQFSHLPADELSRKRRLLQCPECIGPAFFRRASRSGRAACFGARPHSSTCSLAAFDVERIDSGAGEYQDQLYNPGTNIVVDFNFGAAGNSAISEAHCLPDNPARRGRYEGTEPRPNAKMHRRLSSLLRMLIDSHQFRNSEQILEIDDQNFVQVKDFFVNILSISDLHVGRFLGLWGFVSDAKFDAKNTLWLNSGGRDHISFCLSPQIATDVIERFSVSDPEDLAGAYVLVFGTPRVSSNNKLYCTVDGVQCIALRLT